MKVNEDLNSLEFKICGKSFANELIVEKVSKVLSQSRVGKLKKLVQTRTNHIVPILENIYDVGNINAVIRTSENYGLFEIANIASIRLKKATRITQGADKWVDMNSFETIDSCIKYYKNKNYQIAVTALNKNAIDYREIDYTKPTAIIIGNEKDGCSIKAQELADHTIMIPTVGLTQSFNLSVAAAITLSKAMETVVDKKLYSDEKTQVFLLAKYLLRSINYEEQALIKLLTS